MLGSRLGEAQTALFAMLSLYESCMRLIRVKKMPVFECRIHKTHQPLALAP